MQLYRLQHSVSQRCPGCHSKWLAMFVYAETPKEAVMSDSALCPDCLITDRDKNRMFWWDEQLDVTHQWYGVDLDATLARYDGWVDGQIGEPIPAMVQRVKQMLCEGKDVRIFTARVAVTGAYSMWSGGCADYAFAQEQTRLIENWCLEHIGAILPVTAVKDFACIAIYDDRAKQVVPNAGILVEDQISQKPLYVGRVVSKLPPFDEDSLIED
jgi:hypothetical protein